MPERTAEVILERGERARSRAGVAGIVYRGPFCSSVGTIRDARRSLCFHAINIPLPCFFSECRPFYTDVMEGDIQRDNRPVQRKRNDVLSN